MNPLLRFFLDLFVLCLVGVFVLWLMMGYFYDWDGDRLAESASRGSECRNMHPCAYYCVKDTPQNYSWNPRYLEYKPRYEGNNLSTCNCKVVESKPTEYVTYEKDIDFKITLKVDAKKDCWGVE